MRYIILLSGIAIGGIVASWYLPWSLKLPAPQDRIIRIDQANTSGVVDLSTKATPAAPVAVFLPHRWTDRSASEQIYRFDLELNVPPNRLWALYIPELGQNAQLWINDNPIDARPYTHWYRRDGVRSQFFVIPNGVINPGHNDIRLRVVAAHARDGYLGAMYLGPSSVLSPYHESRIQQHRLFGYTALALALLALAAGLLAGANSNDPTYGWLRLSCAAWVVALASQLPTISPVPWLWVHTISQIAQLLAMGCAFVFVLYYIGAATARTNRTATRTMIAGTSVVVVATIAESTGIDTAYYLKLLVMLALQGVGCHIGYRLIRYLVAEPQLSGTTLVIIWLGASLVGLSLYDIVEHWQIRNPTLPAALHLSPVLFLALSYLLFSRFAAALQSAEQQTLALRSQLGGSAPISQMVVQERERIMRDMHDGVGGHLVSSLAILRNRNIADPDLEELLNQALTDLRLMIDSLEDTDGDLSAAIAMLKQRTNKALTAAGIASRWTIDEINLPDRGPTDTLQILRILQEALANVAKHAQATEIEVRAQMVSKATGEPTAIFAVSDNGTGFDKTGTDHGRGLLNMQQRAHRIGAELTIEPTAEGTHVQLIVSNQVEDGA